MKKFKLSKEKCPKALKCSKFKEFIHPLLLKVLSIKTTGKLIVEGNLPKNENCLIVANHVCIEDIPTLAQAVKDHFYLLVSDEDKKTMDGIALSINGVQWVHRLDKESRNEAFNNAIKILKSGKNFAMYPESTWNLSPNQLIMPMNYGCIRIALEANVPIVPVVSFFTKEKRYTKIGEKFYPSKNLVSSISELRDIMATMLYDEIEQNYKENYGKPGVYKKIINGEEIYYENRSDISKNYWENYIADKYNEYARAKKDKSGVREFESQFIFSPKNDKFEYFQLFNSVIKCNKKIFNIKRISSEKNGYNGSTFGEINNEESFGYGYNEKILKKQLKKES